MNEETIEKLRTLNYHASTLSHVRHNLDFIAKILGDVNGKEALQEIASELSKIACDISDADSFLYNTMYELEGKLSRMIETPVKELEKKKNEEFYTQ